MKSDDRVIVAGRIGRYFRIDPLVVLDANYFEWGVRIAAFEVAVAEETAAIERAKNR